MSSILAGLFERHSDYKRLENELETSGFENSDYIVYLTEDHHQSQYMASVEIKDNEQAQKAHHVFHQNSVLKTYIFENMNIGQASYSNVKKYIDARSKAEIHNSPDVKKKSQHSGMDSEVKF
jgi:CRISPR/Cas system-associated exonuclease Cas4 (RecB family)